MAAIGISTADASSSYDMLADGRDAFRRPSDVIPQIFQLDIQKHELRVGWRDLT